MIQVPVSGKYSLFNIKSLSEFFLGIPKLLDNFFVFIDNMKVVKMVFERIVKFVLSQITLSEA